MLAVFAAAFCFAHAEHNVIKFNLYNNWSAQAVNIISESTMSNSSKSIEFSHLQKLANQSTLNGAHVIEIKKTCTNALMESRTQVQRSADAY